MADIVNVSSVPEKLSLWQRIKAFFTKAADLFSLFLYRTKGGEIVRMAIVAAIQEVGPVILDLLMQQALRKARQLDSKTESGYVKFSELTGFIADVAVKEGIEVSESLVNHLAETAVRALRGEQASGKTSVKAS